MNKQASIILYMIFTVILISVVLISKTTILRLDIHNKIFSQKISYLESRIISFFSTLKPANKNKQSHIVNHTDNNLSSIISQLTNKLAQQDKQIAFLNLKIESALTHLKRIDSANQLVNNVQESTLQRDKQITSNKKRFNEAEFKARQATIQARQYAEFQNEIVDPYWSDTTQNELMMLFDQKAELAGANLTISQCRTTSCEISWTIDNNLDDFERFELENNILVELARIGLDSTVGVGSAGSSSDAIK